MSKWRERRIGKDERGGDLRLWTGAPWIVGFLSLVGPNDAWVGTEERMFHELKAFTGEGAGRSTYCPRTLDELHNYMASTRDAFDELDLDLLDYRELSGDPLKYWREEVTYLPGASGWGPKRGPCGGW